MNASQFISPQVNDKLYGYHNWEAENTTWVKAVIYNNFVGHTKHVDETRWLIETRIFYHHAVTVYVCKWNAQSIAAQYIWSVDAAVVGYELGQH